MAKKKPTRPSAKKTPFKKGLPKKPLWTWDAGVSFSSLSTWLEDQEQFALKYVEGWTSRRISVSLEFGSLIHYCLEKQFNFSTPEECATTVCQSYYDYRSKTVLNSTERDSLDFVCRLAVATFPAYCRFWYSDDQSIDWLSREQKFSVPYTLPNGIVVNLRGMRDGVFRLKKSLGIFETKTKSRIDEREIVSGLRADMQTLFYVVATREEIGELPSRIEYNIIRRSGLKPRKNEPMTDFISRIKDDVNSRPEHYFQRYEVTLLKSDITRFEEETLQPELMALHRWWEGVKKNPLGKRRFDYPYHRRNLNALVGKYGRADLWDIMVDNNYHNFRVRKDVFPELVDSFQGM